MNQTVKNTLRRSIRALMHIAPVRHAARRVTHHGVVPRDVWDRLPVVEPEFRVALPGGGTFVYHSSPGDGIGQALYWRGVDYWEADTIRVFLALARSARRFVDIGSNTGPYTLLCAAVNPDVYIIAYEPVPRIHERLSANIAANRLEGRVEARKLALSSRAGISTFHVPNTILPTSASLAESGFRNIPGQLIQVETVTADDDIAGARPIDLVKIDVEGFEHDVLGGMGHILAEDRPIIICECNPDGPYQAIEALLAPHGYVFFHLRAPTPVAMTHIVPDASEQHRNYACVPVEKRARVDAMCRSS
jgi:FkbM family methyltransferase